MAEQLPELVPTTHVLPGLTDEAARATGLVLEAMQGRLDGQRERERPPRLEPVDQEAYS